VPVTAPSEPLTADQPDPGQAGTSRSPLSSVGRIALVGVVAASFGIWVYAFSGLAGRDAPDLLDDPAFAVAAERRCAAALADISALPGAAEAIDGPDRAGQIEVSTERLDAMLGELDGLVGGSDRDVEITTGWLADWRVLLRDRYDYANRIAEDPSAQFLITNTGAAERLDRRITRVADTNSMPSCAAPDDVG